MNHKLLFQFVRVAHEYPEISSDLTPYIMQGLGDSSPRLRLAALCVASPEVFEECAHLVDFSSVRVASEGERLVHTLFKLAATVQQEAKARGRTLKRFQDRAPRGEGKKFRQKNKRFNKIMQIRRGIKNYERSGNFARGAITRLVKRVLRDGKPIQKAPIAKKFTDAMEKAKNVEEKVKILNNYGDKAILLLKSKDRDKDKKESKPKPKSTGAKAPTKKEKPTPAPTKELKKPVGPPKTTSAFQAVD